jgi:cell wall-associated NlpC family hydrolase
LNIKNIFNKSSCYLKPLLGIVLVLLLTTACRKKHTPASSTNGKAREKSSSKRYETREIEKLIKTAKSYIGTCYRYGGSTRSGMDCSGLVVTSFKTLDIILPRTSAQQSDLGKKVPLDDIRQGDLVFFSDKKGHKKVTHVGLVTEVTRDQIKFIHSSTQLGVIENDLLSDYYKSIFLKAVRILP